MEIRRRGSALDLRLMPGAILVWMVAGLGVGASGEALRPIAATCACVCGAGVLVALALVVAAGGRRLPGRGRGSAANGYGLPGRGRPLPANGRRLPDSGSSSPRPTGRFGVIQKCCGATILAFGLACVAAWSCSQQLDVRDSSQVSLSAAQGRVERMLVTVTSEPAESVAGFDGKPTMRVAAMGTVMPNEQKGVVPPDGQTKADAPVPVLILGSDAWADIEVGTQVSFIAKLRPAEEGDAVVALVMAKGEPEVVERPGVLDRAVNHVRQSARSLADVPGDGYALIPAMSTGDRSALGQELSEAMKVSSLSHMTAVSGSHLVIVLGVTGALIGLLPLPRRGRIVISALALGAFVLLVRSGPSVLRAGAMSACGLIAMLLGRRSRAVPALCGCVALLMIRDPWLARDYGFALSTGATLGIAMLSGPWTRWLERWLPQWLAAAIGIPLAAQCACGPILILLTPSVSPHSVLLNMIAGPVLAPATLASCAAAGLAVMWPWGGGLLAVAASWPNAVIAWVSRAGAALPGVLLPWWEGWFGVLALTLFTVCIAVAGRLIGRRFRRREEFERRRVAWTLAGVVVGLVALIFPLQSLLSTLNVASWLPSDWKVVACDVGQGDMLVVSASAGGGGSSAMVVDVGPDPGLASKCLDALGIREVELLVLSHDHADHVGGLDGVLSGRNVDRVLVSAYQGPMRSMVEETLSGAGIEPEVVSQATRGLLGDFDDSPLIEWTVLSRDGPAEAATAEHGSASAPEHPSADPSASASSRVAEDSDANNHSLAIVVSEPGLTFVSFGDLETDGQQWLLRTLEDQGLAKDCDVLKLAHHGSAKQSEELARWLNPRAVLVSVGGGNTYGHPSSSALKRYSGAALIARTDIDGTTAIGTRSGEEVGELWWSAQIRR